MKFKMGDKVKFVNYIHPTYNGKVGVIVEVWKSTVKYPYRVEVDRNFSPPVLESEIDFYRKKGEQLLLFEL